MAKFWVDKLAPQACNLTPALAMNKVVRRWAEELKMLYKSLSHGDILGTSPCVYPILSYPGAHSLTGQLGETGGTMI